MALFNPLKMKKLLLHLILVFPFVGNSQQESFYTLYPYNMVVINPAYAGAEAASMLSLTSRRQWAAMEDAPNTLALAYSSARANNVGLGISVVSDKVFIEQQTFAYIDFSYRLTLNESTQLFLGLKGGGNFYRSDPASLSLYTASDPAQRQLSSFNPNIGAGAYLQHSLFWVSISAPRLFNVKRQNTDLAITAKDRVHSYMAAGLYLPLGEKLQFKPSMILRKIKGLPLTTDLTAMLNWQNKFELGISSRSNHALGILTMLSLGTFDIGYAYETPTDNGLSQLNLKSHELVLRFRINAKDYSTKTGPESTDSEQ